MKAMPEKWTGEDVNIVWSGTRLREKEKNGWVLLPKRRHHGTVYNRIVAYTFVRDLVEKLLRHLFLAARL
jgi:hypothetical protein